MGLQATQLDGHGIAMLSTYAQLPRFCMLVRSERSTQYARA